MNTKKYEVEIKVELTDAERIELLGALKRFGFTSHGITPQADYYIQADKSPYGGVDLKRYRDEDGKLIYTEKIWEIHNGERVRREIEREVAKAELEKAVAEHPDAPSIKKEREWFRGSYKETEISFTIDSVQFNNSKQLRYFVEAEIDVSQPDEVPKIKSFLQGFLKDILKRSEIIEAPGMYSLAVSNRS